MHARVPQDVDLEDKLIYGLSPLRFAYLVVAVLAALSISRLTAAPALLRAGPCLVLVGAGAALAWGRWRGRPVDRLLWDLVVFARRNYRLGLRATGACRPAPRRLRPARRSGSLRRVPPAGNVVPLGAINAVRTRGEVNGDATDHLPPAA